MVIDVVDGGNFRFIGIKLKSPKEDKEVKKDIRETQDLIQLIKDAGGNAIVVYGMCDAIGYVVDRIKERARSHGVITLLRFFSHGGPGMMGLTGGYGDDMSGHLADFGPKLHERAKQHKLHETAKQRRETAERSLDELRPYFHALGQVQLHGCDVGQGKAGVSLLRWMAEALGVPVSAGIRSQVAVSYYQYEGSKKWIPDSEYAFRFEGPVRTAYPGKKRTEIKSWKKHPSLPGYVRESPPMPDWMKPDWMTK